MKQKPKALWSSLLVGASLVCGSMANGARPLVPDRSQPESASGAKPTAQPGEDAAGAKPAAKPETGEGATRSAAKGEPIGDALRKVSAGLTRQEAQITIDQVEGTERDIEARKVFVSTSGSLVDRWRGVPKPGEKLTGILDIRSGFAGRVSLSVDGATHLSVGHLTRARIGRMNTGGDGPSASRIVIELIRGHVDVRPPRDGIVNVLTADGITSVREPTVVSFDAVRGTVLSLPGVAAADAEKPRTDTEKR